ncbi:MAG: precorrin-6y C5,15-methyltransferase (decarboxylating) subunit CbiE [Pseudomonadota bacterium]
MVIDVVSLGTALIVPPSAANALQQADVVIGASRHFESVDCGDAEKIVYPSPLDNLADVLDQHAGKNTVVLASGDALYFGIGSWLLRNVGSDDLRFHPNVTTVQSACARIGKPWQSVAFVSLHGRPMRRLRATLGAGKTLAVFTDAKNTPQKIARELVDTGFEESQVHVLEALDSAQEKITQADAATLAAKQETFNPLNLLFVEVQGEGGLLPAFPGIDDAVFAEGGDNQFTKREVRLAALSRLSLSAGEVGWDIGAGSGGIAIEWARWSPLAHVFAIERDEKRQSVFRTNLDRFGDHGNLDLIDGAAPDACENLPDPDAIYIGGTDGALSDVLEICWQRLRSGGRLVAAGVTLETRTALQGHAWPVAAEFTELSISHAAPLGSHTTMRAQLPVLLATARKP